MLTPQLERLYNELGSTKGKLSRGQFLLFSELELLIKDEIISTRCSELSRKLPPGEVPPENRCPCCGISI